MLDKLCRDACHLEKQLQCKLNEEYSLNIVQWISRGDQDAVCEWVKIVRWMRQINQQCAFKSDTFSLAVCILDKFIGAVKVHGKYLKCAAAACCYSAAKICEERQPSLSNFVASVLLAKFTRSDLQRMELIVLQKIGWRLPTAIPTSFLELFFGLICSRHFETVFGSDSLAYNIFVSLGCQLEMSLCSESLQTFKGSLMALALLSCTLEKITSRWFLYIEPLTSLAQITVQDLLVCRDVIKRIIFGLPQTRKIVRQRKFARRRNALLMSSPSSANRLLSPIVENPFEMECSRSRSDDEDGYASSSMTGSFSDDPLDSFQEPAFECDSPAKRRKLVPCNVQSHLMTDDTTGHVTAQWNLAPTVKI